jgi:hypothetical protein
VTFFSGVSVDLVALGVPVVELLDVRGLPEHDRPDARRDADGRILFGPYRRDGLVIAADDVEDLRLALAAITAARDDSLAPLMRALRARFADPDGATERLLRCILSA